MVSSRVATALVGSLASLGISIAAWILFDTLLLFLLVPAVPLLFRRRGETASKAEKRCPVCGFATREPSFTHCPRDGTRLQ
jgi:uncharacterized membrane protein YdfJ with MMPL/SSD domain